MNRVKKKRVKKTANRKWVAISYLTVSKDLVAVGES